MGLIDSVWDSKHLHLNVLSPLLLDHGVVFLKLDLILMSLAGIGTTGSGAKFPTTLVQLIFGCIFIGVCWSHWVVSHNTGYFHLILDQLRVWNLYNCALASEVDFLAAWAKAPWINLSKLLVTNSWQVWANSWLLLLGYHWLSWLSIRIRPNFVVRRDSKPLDSLHCTDTALIRSRSVIASTAMAACSANGSDNTWLRNCDLLISLLVLKSLSHERLVVTLSTLLSTDEPVGVHLLRWKPSVAWIRILRDTSSCLALNISAVRCDLKLYVRELSRV